MSVQLSDNHHLALRNDLKIRYDYRSNATRLPALNLSSRNIPRPARQILIQSRVNPSKGGAAAVYNRFVHRGYFGGDAAYGASFGGDQLASTGTAPAGTSATASGEED